MIKNTVLALSLAIVLIASVVSVMPAYAADNDPPQIRWLDTVLHDGVNTFTIAIKDASPITVKQITYTRYDSIFEEYDEITVPLVATTTANIYKVDITVYSPQTIIEVRVADNQGNDDDDKKKFSVTPNVFDLNIVAGVIKVPDGGNPTVTVINGHAFSIPVTLDVRFTGLSSASSYQQIVTDRVPAVGNKAISIPVAIAPDDRFKTVSMYVKLKAYEFTKEVTIDGVTFEGKKPVPSNSPHALKGRYERLSSALQFDLPVSVARAVFILQVGDTVMTPSGVNLYLDAFTSDQTTGVWKDRIYFASDDTPIEYKSYLTATGRPFFIIEVPEIGIHKSNLPSIVLLRHYS